MAPVEGGAQRLLALRQVAAPPVSSWSLWSAARAWPRRQQLRARSGQLERQRQSVQAATDLGHGWRLSSVTSKRAAPPAPRTARLPRTRASSRTRAGDGGTVSGGTTYSNSPRSLSTARLVIRTFRSGTPASSSETPGPAATHVRSCRGAAAYPDCAPQRASEPPLDGRLAGADLVDREGPGDGGKHEPPGIPDRGQPGTKPAPSAKSPAPLAAPPLGPGGSCRCRRAR